MKPSFLAALQIPETQIELNSQIAINVGRASFDRHLLLGELIKQVRKQPSPESIRKYLLTAGLTDDQLDQMTGQRQLTALFKLIDLNRLRWLLPFLQQQDDGTKAEGDELAYDYQDRAWTVWIHQIASRYGWSRAEIMAMQPEEVAMYIQEITLSEFDEYEQDRLNSRMNYQVVDKKTGKLKFVPLPRPGWMTPVSTPESRVMAKVKIPEGAKPIGVVIDHTNIHEFIPGGQNGSNPQVN